MHRRHLAFWLLTLAYGAAFMLPQLAAEGTFLDGEIYAVLARNYAEGMGGLWSPHFSAAIRPEWYEHPPAGLWVMSGAYRLLGDHPLVEHAYALVTVVVGAWLLVLLWRRLHADRPDLRALAWLPLLLWWMNPQVTWAYANVMLENSAVPWVLAALLALLAAAEGGRARALAGGAVAGAAVVAAVLTKGPVGFFPLAAPALLSFATRRPRPGRAAAVIAVMLALIGLAAAGLLAWPEARHGLGRYLDHQLLSSLRGERGGRPDPGAFLSDLLNTLLPALGLVLVVLAVAWRRGEAARVDAAARRRGLFLLLLGLAGSLPVGASPRHALFYCVPSFPCYALGLAALAAPVVAPWTAALARRPRASRWTALGTGLLLAAVLAFSATRLGSYGRDAEVLPDIKAIRAHLAAATPGGDTRGLRVAACRNLWTHWSLYAHTARYGGLAVERDLVPRRWLLVRGACDGFDLAAYRRVPLDTRTYHLYERR